MRYIRKIPKGRGLNEPILHADHRRPVTRRELLSAGLIGGSATVLLPGLLLPRAAHADVKTDLAGLILDNCGLQGGAGMVPFIAFDLSGGANIAGSNALVGKLGGQLDFLSTAGYSKLGIPGNMTPNLAGAAGQTFIDQSFGVAFHSDSAMLRGMKRRATTASTAARTNGAVIAARSENDTGNNPHNPMYGIARTGSRGGLLTLIGSVSSDSGGNSQAPAAMIDPKIRPTKVDRASDVTGLVDTGELGTLFLTGTGQAARDAAAAKAVSVMESMAVLTNLKHGKVSTGLADDAGIKDFNKCGYVKSAYLAEQFSDPAFLNPDIDPDIVGPAGIWTQAEYSGDSEFRKTAAVMKMVISGNAGAGTIQMGGFDYHTGDRSTGEARDERAGQCIGACLEYAARTNKPLMIYVFSDGSLNSNGMIDNSTGGRGKGVWTGDNQSTAASLLLVYQPSGPPAMMNGAGNLPRNQIGFFTADGSVSTTSHPGANAVNQLVEVVILNYLAVNGQQGQMQSLFPTNGLGSALDNWTAFANTKLV